jgi:raffinose/stachyose/melibiose transport system permease protein
MKNSAIITFGTLAILTLIAPMAAFFLSRKGLFGKSAVFYLLLIGMFVAPHSMMVPTYKLMSQVHLADSLLGLIVLYVASGLPYCIFIIRPSFLMIPKSLEESAKIDGLSTFKIYWRILFPLVKSALVVALILEGVFVWNDFFYPLLLLRTASKYTLPLCLYVFQGAHFIRYGPLCASILISAIPMVLLYVFLADQIRKGIAAQVGVKA